MSRFGIKLENSGSYWADLRIMLKKIRLLCGYSHADVAEALGINRSTYTCYELGRTVPDVIMLVALARLYDIPPECFLHPEEFTDLETLRCRAPKKVRIDPKRVGELSAVERQMIAKFRMGGAKAENTADGLPVNEGI